MGEMPTAKQPPWPEECHELAGVSHEEGPCEYEDWDALFLRAGSGTCVCTCLSIFDMKDPGKAEESVGAGTSIVDHSKCFSWEIWLCIGKFYAKEV